MGYVGEASIHQKKESKQKGSIVRVICGRSWPAEGEIKATFLFVRLKRTSESRCEKDEDRIREMMVTVPIAAGISFQEAYFQESTVIRSVERVHVEGEAMMPVIHLHRMVRCTPHQLDSDLHSCRTGTPRDEGTLASASIP